MDKLHMKVILSKLITKERKYYYIGNFKNGLKEWKGIICNKNGQTRYESDFVNNKKEGHGKIIFENGEYYFGNFKNDMPHGKGKDYYSYGKLMIEGDYISDYFDGNGKLIKKNGDYGIGQFKNHLIEKRIEYDKYDNIIKEYH